MMATPTVFLIGADKGGVGKTTVARTLIEYLTAQEISTRAFDTESPKGALHRFHPKITEIVDVTEVSGQMRIFDTVSDSSVTVIDVRAGLLSSTLRTLRNIEFLDSAKKGQLTFVVFHILGSSIESLNEIKDLSGFARDCKYFLVKNFINETSFFEWDQPTHSSYFKKFADAVEITIPKLNERAFEEIELASVPFAAFIANKDKNGDIANYSFVLRGYVRHWLSPKCGTRTIALSSRKSFNSRKSLPIPAPRRAVRARKSRRRNRLAGRSRSGKYNARRTELLG
jgi:hypothetical protein